MLEKYVHIHPEVQKSISAEEPIVALDSSIIFNNFPYPQSIEISNNISKIIRDKDVVPATMAIINGVLKIGLTEDELEFLALNKDLTISSKKLLPFIISKRLTCSTTLDISIILANMIGLNLIVTGKLMDSLDLLELSTKNIAIIGSQIKDITNDRCIANNFDNLGISVVEYNSKANSPMDIAKAIKIKHDLELNGCMLINNIEYDRFDLNDIYNNIILASDISKDLSLLNHRN
ncbi:MAG: pseudouridine-5'-phosphate glycosidase [Peptostreptococcaceae bacterium]